MSRRPIVLTLGTLGLLGTLSLGCASSAPADEFSRRSLLDDHLRPGRHEVSGSIGGREFEDAAWSPVEDPVAFGVTWAWQPPGAWFALEAGYQFTYDDGSYDFLGVGDAEIEARTSEFSAGLLRWFESDRSNLRAYVGGGASLLYANLDAEEDATGDEVFDRDDTAWGGYGKVGVGYSLGIGEWIGLEYRILRGADLDLLGPIDGDYEQLALVFSSSF